MESNVVESGACGGCGSCGGGAALAVLRDVQRAHRDRVDLVDRIGGANKLQMKVEVLQSWVNDLVAQNTLLASTVEELETELTSRLLERRRHAEIEIELRAEAEVLRRRLARKDSDLRGLLEVLRRLREFDFYAIDGIHFNEVTESDIFGSALWKGSKLEQGDVQSDNKDKNKVMSDKVNEIKIMNDSLKKENSTKEREIRRLNKDIERYEQTITCLRNELAISNFRTPDVPKKDAQVMAEICCTNKHECNEEPVKESEVATQEHPMYQERIHQLEHSGKSSSELVSLRQMNASLREEVRALQRVCAALDEQGRLAALRAAFKDDVIHEMRRQLRQAKSKPGMVTSTPNVSREEKMDMRDYSDVSIIERSPSPPLLISDSSIDLQGVSKVIEISGTECDCGPQILEDKRNKTKIPNKSLAENIEKFNSGEIKQEQQHASHALQDSIASSVGSAGSDGRALYLESKLMATMQVLKNKEETIRVQEESLSLAEARIAALTSKAQNKMHQEQQTNPLLMRSSADGNHLDMKDVSATVQNESKIVKTLRDNLCVIEELYRECFYETAKQEELISMLRRSYLDMRLVDRQKSDQINFLQTTLKTQKSSIERYEDIAMEVENLKMEITNFLNSSTNNDSGVWECEPVAELRDIADQLLRLQDLLRTDCICGLEEENKKLKQKSETMEIQINDLQRKVSELELALEDKENIDQKYQKQIEEKEKELLRIRQQLTALEQGTRDQGSACDTLTLQLKQLENMLNDKTLELLTTEQKVESQEATIRNLREELHRVNLIANENQQVREEVSCLSAQVSRWRQQLADSRCRMQQLDDELRRAREHCRHLATLYRDKARSAAALQAQLGEAQARGAELCADAQRATAALRRWLVKQRARRREQEDKIKEQERIIQSLQSNERTSMSENEPCCSKYLPRAEARQSDHSSLHASETDCSKYQSRVGIRRSDRSIRASETTGCSKCAYSRLNLRTSESDAASPLPPTPPRRLLRKKPLCVERPCQCPLTRPAASQRPSRHDALSDTRSCELYACRDTDANSREESGPDELLERVERAHEALASAQRRWGRRVTDTQENDS